MYAHIGRFVFHPELKQALSPSAVEWMKFSDHFGIKFGYGIFHDCSSMIYPELDFSKKEFLYQSKGSSLLFCGANIILRTIKKIIYENRAVKYAEMSLLEK